MTTKPVRPKRVSATSFIVGRDKHIDTERLGKAFDDAQKVVRKTFDREALMAAHVGDVMNMRLRG